MKKPELAKAFYQHVPRVVEESVLSAAAHKPLFLSIRKRLIWPGCTSSMFVAKTISFWAGGLRHLQIVLWEATVRRTRKKVPIGYSFH